MDEAKQRVLEGLAQAIRAEVEGYHFYTMVARTTQDPMGKEVFTRLAEDEQGHAEFLRAQYRAIQATGKIDPNQELGPIPALQGSSIFSERLRERAAEAHFEMTALSIGAQQEADAQRFYRQQAAQAEDPEVKNFYLQLAEWESGHYHALLDQQKALEEEYWAANQFAPF